VACSGGTADSIEGGNLGLADSDGDIARRQPSLVTVDRVRARNFRSLRSIDEDLGPLTVLVGENNSGKTNFMQALVFGLSASLSALDPDDIFAGTSSPGTKGKTVVVGAASCRSTKKATA